MTKENERNSRETIRKLSRKKVGRLLARKVAEKLIRENDGEGLKYGHRDYCGHGLVHLDDQICLVEVHDGLASSRDVVKRWKTTDEFTKWLAEQSDYTLSGADKNRAILKAKDSFSLNNQRLTQLRLLEYVGGN